MTDDNSSKPQEIKKKDFIVEKLSDDELLSALTEGSTQNIKVTEEYETSREIIDHTRNDRNVFLFINDLKLTKGNDKIKVTVLYKLYMDRAYSKMSLINFRKNLGDFFELQKGRIFIDLQNSIFKDILTMASYKTKKRRNDAKTYHTSKRRTHRFLNKYNIQKGEYYIPDYALYNLYDKWGYEGKLKTDSYHVFIQMTTTILPYKHTANGYYFGVNDEQRQTNFTEEHISRLEGYKKEREKKQKKSK